MVHTLEQQGPIETSYELQTNDPKHPTFKISIVANIKPLPAYVKRMTNTDIGHGEKSGGFHFWPTSRPAVSVETGEKLTIALRIRAATSDAGGLTLGPGAPDSWKLRREANGDYWLDILVDGSAGTTSRAAKLVAEGSDGPREILVRLMSTVPSENLVVTPRALDFGEHSLVSLGSAVQRLGVRKLVGSFRIKSINSTLPFLKLQQTTIVEGSNYLIRVTIDSTKPLKAGAYEGVVVVETDEGGRVEAPIKIKLIEP